MRIKSSEIGATREVLKVAISQGYDVLSLTRRESSLEESIIRLLKGDGNDKP